VLFCIAHQLVGLFYLSSASLNKGPENAIFFNVGPFSLLLRVLRAPVNFPLIAIQYCIPIYDVQFYGSLLCKMRKVNL
jgi:hypothetical protein